jgi:hypothetical protein
MTSAYHETRLEHDPRRDVVWKAFGAIISATSCPQTPVCSTWVAATGSSSTTSLPGVASASTCGTAFRNTSIRASSRSSQALTQLDGIEDGSVDFAFASNLFEHIAQPDFTKVLTRFAPS